MFIRLSRRCDFRHLREPLVKCYYTQGLSKDRYAGWVSRKSVPKLYYKEFLSHNPAFLFNEERRLCTIRREAAGARRADVSQRRPVSTAPREES